MISSIAQLVFALGRKLLHEQRLGDRVSTDSALNPKSKALKFGFSSSTIQTVEAYRDGTIKSRRTQEEA